MMANKLLAYQFFLIHSESYEDNHTVYIVY